MEFAFFKKANPSISGTGTVTFRMQASDPQNDLSDDQIFALNPDLGVAVSLVPAGGDVFERTYQMPSLPSGSYRWYFFAVDHKCNTSSILTVDYAVP